MKVTVSISVLTSLLLNLASPALAEISNKNFIAGFVFDKNEMGLIDSRILVTHEGKLIQTLRTDSSGWFEATEPLPEYATGIIILTVLKKGYSVESVDVSGLKGYFEKIKLTELNPELRSDIAQNFPSGRLYGKVVDPLTKTGLPGIQVSLLDNKNNLLGSGFTRDSGYFTVHYNSEEIGKMVSIETPQMYRKGYLDYKSEEFELQNAPVLYSVNATKPKFLHWHNMLSFGLGIREEYSFEDGGEDITASRTGYFFRLSRVYTFEPQPHDIRYFTSNGGWDLEFGVGVAWLSLEEEDAEPDEAFSSEYAPEIFAGVGYSFEVIRLSLGITSYRIDNDWVDSAQAGVFYGVRW